MFIEVKTIVEDQEPRSNTNTTTNIQRVNRQERRQDSKRVLTALSGKQKEPNRGQGTERRPGSPRAHVTGPTHEGMQAKDWKKILKGKITGANDASQFTAVGEFQRNPVFEEDHMLEILEQTGIVDLLPEARESEHTANRHLSNTTSTKNKPGHYLMKHGSPMHKEPHASSSAALSAYKALSNSTGVSIRHIKEDETFVAGPVKTLSEFKKSTLGSVRAKTSIKEDAPAMSSGGAGDPGHVQNATDNYASQLERRKKNIKNMVRRKKPIGE